MARPRIPENPMYHLLRESKVEEFNQRRQNGEQCDLCGCDFSRVDLREMHADGLDLSDCYFRMTDLRGLDLRNARLEGASFAGAHISGTYFPTELRADELLMSIEHGTRVRYCHSEP